MTQTLPADAPVPRLCVIEKLDGENEYGYNLHAEKGRGQFVGIVDAGSPAERGGLLTGDRIFAVNGHSIIGENHKKVVERIKANPGRCEMLVVSEEGAKWYREHDIQVTLHLPNIHRVNEKNVSSSLLRPSSNGSPPPSSWYAPTTYLQSKLETPVFVPPPPPPQENPMEPLPRLAHLEKTRPDEEFGFNLHAERGKGHFIGTVDAGGVGQHAGLEMGQRIVGVNGHLITPATKHPEVVALIKRDKMKTSLLVASPEVDKWHTENHVAYSFDRHETFHDDADHHHQHHQHHEEAPPLPKSNGYEVAPSLNPHSIQVNEEREVSKLTTTTKTEVISTNSSSYQYKVDQNEQPPPLIVTTCSFLNETTTSYDAYSTPPANADDLMSAVFAKVELPTVGHQQHVTVHSHELAEDASSISSLTSSSHRESAVDVPVSHQYVPSYVSQSHQEHSQTQTHPHQHHQHHHHHHQQHQQPSPLSNGSSHGYAASSTSGYDDDDIYHLSAKEARERLRMKNRKHHLHEMSLNEKYQLVSNM